MDESVTGSDFMDLLEQTKNEIWDSNKRGDFWRYVTSGSGLNVPFYQHLLREFFFCIRHATQSLGVGAALCSTADWEVARFAYGHASEEVGHEQMISADLAAMGLPPEYLERGPLPDTQAFIGYMYYLSMFRGARSRLGMTYWAEGSYQNLGTLLDTFPSLLSLGSNQVTFLAEHASLDVDHFDNVRAAIVRFCTTAETQGAVLEVLQTSLTLFGRLLDGATREFLASGAYEPSTRTP